MAMQGQMLSFHEFSTRFAHGCRYGILDPWPKETILFFRLAGAGICTAWKKISSLYTNGEHVENRMLKDVELILTCLPLATYTLEIVLSYSPCRKCSDELIKFKNRFKSSPMNFRLTITISTFYQTSNPRNTYHMDGLVNLVTESVILKIFDGDSDWMEFLRDFIYLLERHLRQWLSVTWNPARRTREYIDSCILRDIYGYCSGEVSKDDLCEMAAVANPMQVLEIYRRRNHRSFVLQLGHHWY